MKEIWKAFDEAVAAARAIDGAARAIVEDYGDEVADACAADGLDGNITFMHGEMRLATSGAGAMALDDAVRFPRPGAPAAEAAAAYAADLERALDGLADEEARARRGGREHVAALAAEKADAVRGILEML